MYVDKLDGVVDTVFFFEKMSNSGVRSRSAASARSTGANPLIDPTWMKAFSFSSSLKTHKSCSSGKHRAKNVACSISYYRTAHGRTAKWSPTSVNHLTY